MTATVDGAQEDLDFYVGLLSLRLVKKTVNFDNHNVYHFYYGDERGSPSTIWTTFPYRGMDVPVGTRGAGQITATSFSVPTGSIAFWKARLRGRGMSLHDVPPRFGDEAIMCVDPSGLAIELVANNRDDRQPWTTDDVTQDAAIRGLYGVTMVIRAPEKAIELLTGLLGFTVVNETEDRIRLAIGGEEPGKILEIVPDAGAPLAANGLGTVHHVALAIADEDEQIRLRQELVRLGLQPTQVLDRQYFRSIYFRVPGGVLFEVATMRPGFTVDESLPCLGQDLKLPLWEEPHRPAIEAALPAIRLG